MRRNVGNQILYAAMKDVAEIIQLCGRYALSLADSIDGTTANVVFINEGICAFAAATHSFPKFVIDNHFKSPNYRILHS